MTCVSRADRSGAVDLFERAAVAASLLCLVHCVGLPLIVAVLPALSELVRLPDSVHFWLLAFALPVSGVALVLGYRAHRRISLILLGAGGLCLMAIGGVIFGGRAADTVLTLAGSLTLAAAHLRNWRLRHGHHAHG